MQPDKQPDPVPEIPAGSQSDPENEYRLLFTANPTPMFVFDEESLAFLAVNDAAVATYGWSRDEFLTMTVLDIRPTGERDAARQVIQANKNVNSKHIGVFPHTRKDGSVMEMEISVSSITFSGRPARLCLLTDITDRIRTEEALRRSEERFHGTLENMIEGCQLIDRDWRYLFVNSAAARHGRCRQEELVGKTMMEAYPGIEHTPLFTSLNKCMTERRPNQTDNEFIYPDGSSAWFRLVMQPVPEGIFILSMDITARRQDEKEREMTMRFLHLVNTGTGLTDLLEKSVRFFREYAGFDAVGVRLKKEDDYPYFETQGFSGEFIARESKLRSGPVAGNPLPDDGFDDCICSRVISGKAVSGDTGISKHGNFWTNDITADGPVPCGRARCALEGFRSIGLFTLKADGNCIGLLQLNDRRRDLFTPETAALWERLAGYLSVAVAKSIAREELNRSRQEWVDTVNSIPDLISIIDNRHRIVRVNKAMADKLGIEPEAAKGLHCYRCVHGGESPIATCPHMLLLRDNQEHVAEIYEKNLGGEFLVSVTPVTDSNGAVNGCVHVARDISELKKRERELNKLNRVLAALGKSSHAMSRATNEKEYLEEICRIIVDDCNHAMVWIGFADNDSGKSVRPVASAGFDQGYLAELNITWADTERGRGPTGTAIRTGKVTRCRNMQTDPDFSPWRLIASEKGYASSIVLPLCDGPRTFGALNIYSREPDAFTDDETALLTDLANDLAHGIVVIRETAGRRKAEEELAAANRELEAFSYSVSHDLRAPLRAIFSFSGMLEEEYAEKLDNHGRDYLSRIGAGARKMNSLIDDIMHLSQISSHAIVAEDIDMSDIALQIIEELRQSQPHRRAQITVAPDLRVTADRRLIEIALTNLLQNAWKYTGKREETVIAFGCELIDEEQIFHIRDNGAGFDMKHAARLFTAFTRLHRERDFPGTGIGLAIVNRVIARHGGRIWAEGRPDAGACFKFTLQAPVSPDTAPESEPC